MSTEIDKMTVKEFLDKMTDDNWHTERFVIEAIIDGRPRIMDKARWIWEGHALYGYMPDELGRLRSQTYKEMDEE